MKNLGCYTTRYFVIHTDPGSEIWEAALCRTCDQGRVDKEFVENFGEEASWETSTQKTEKKMGE